MTSLQTDTVSRRTALAGLGAVSLALATRNLDAFAQDATPVPLQHDSGVQYGDGDASATQLDVFWTDHDHLRPALILIHGGVLVAFSRFDFGFPQMAQTIAQAGYIAFNIDYRLFSPDDGSNPWPAQLDDAQRVVRWVRANAATYGVDPERIGALGHSSGGQLATFLGTRATRDNSDAALADFSSRVSCVVDLAGVVDGTIPFPNEDFNALTAALLGGTADTPPDPAAYRDFSPITFVDETSASFLILQGAADADVLIEHSRRMTNRLHDAGVEVVSGEFPGVGHVDILDWNLVGAQILAFLGRHLQPDH
jgi:acetyl esterase/lipase